MANIRHPIFMRLDEYQVGVVIDLGNDTMREPEHVAWALRQLATKFENGIYTGKIADVNGNTVGQFHVNYWPDTPATEGR